VLTSEPRHGTLAATFVGGTQHDPMMTCGTRVVSAEQRDASAPLAGHLVHSQSYCRRPEDSEALAEGEPVGPDSA
jgi:hypothetical protein